MSPPASERLEAEAPDPERHLEVALRLLRDPRVADSHSPAELAGPRSVAQVGEILAAQVRHRVGLYGWLAPRAVDNVARPAMLAATVALATHPVVNVTLVGERRAVVAFTPQARAVRRRREAGLNRDRVDSEPVVEIGCTSPGPPRDAATPARRRDG